MDRPQEGKDSEVETLRGGVHGVEAKECRGLLRHVGVFM